MFGLGEVSGRSTKGGAVAPDSLAATVNGASMVSGVPKACAHCDELPLLAEHGAGTWTSGKLDDVKGRSKLLSVTPSTSLLAEPEMTANDAAVWRGRVGEGGGVGKAAAVGRTALVHVSDSPRVKLSGLNGFFASISRFQSNHMDA